MDRDQEIRFKRKCELDLIRKTIKRIHVKQQKSDEKLAQMKLELRNVYRMSSSWIENTWKWLQKKADDKAKSKKKSLRSKLDKLLEEKQMLKDLSLEEKTMFVFINKPKKTRRRRRLYTITAAKN